MVDMKQRIHYMSHSLIALIVGVAVYLLFRCCTHLHCLFGLPLEGIFSAVEFPCDDIVRYHLPDFLWGYALSFCFGAIMLPSKRGWWWIVGASTVLGFVWEIMQASTFVSGTADGWDCFMYLTAGVAVLIITSRKEEKR